MNGRLRARFACRAGRTRTVCLAAEPPLRGLALRGGAELMVATLGPGLMGGDRHQVDVAVEPGASASVSAQAATRVLVSRGGFGARVDVRLDVARGARLDWRPLPTILQAGAVYHQRVCVRVAPGAFARLWDVIVPGRLACGECFAFEELDAAVRAEAADGTLLAAERLRLRPGVEDPTALGRLPGPNVVVGSLWLLAPGRPLGGCAEQVAAVLGGQAAARASSPQPHAPHEGARCGVSELPNEAGLLVRALGPSAEAVERTLDLAAWLFPQS